MAAGRTPVSCRASAERVQAASDAAILRDPMVKVGGEVDALCTKCQLTLAHTVHAVVAGRPVKVECNTCHAVHRYRGAIGSGSGRSAAAGARAAPGGRAAPRAKATAVGFDDLLAERRGDAVPYSPKRTFAVDEVVDHPIFGRGFVSALRDGSKIEVTFRSDVKLLVHARG
jgi:hypothetical protein